MIRALSLLCLSFLLVGCGSKPEPGPAALSTEHLLEIVDVSRPRHDPKSYAEVPLGSFRTTHGQDLENDLLTITCDLIAIIPENRQQAFADSLAQHQQRLRDRVIAVLQGATAEQLSDPELSQLKDSLRAQLTRTLENTSIRDIVFGTFSTSRGN